MSKQTEALKLALEALESKYIVNCGAWRVQQNQAITAIREALEQPEVWVTPKLRPLAKLAKELDGVVADVEQGDGFDDVCLDTVKYVRDELAEQPAQQEPVAGQPLPCPFCGHIGLDFSDGDTYRWGVASCGGCGASCGDIRREYPDEGKWHSEAIAEWNKRTSPPASKPWVGLTDEEIDYIANYANGLYSLSRAIEAKLREKNA